MDEMAERRNANQALVERFAAAIGARDWETLRAVLTPDFVLETPYRRPARRLEGIEDYLGYVEGALEVFRFELCFDRIHACLDPDQLIAEYRSDGIATPTGKPYRNVYVGVWRFRGDRICSLREYWNPLISAAALERDGLRTGAGVTSQDAGWPGPAQ